MGLGPHDCFYVSHKISALTTGEVTQRVKSYQLVNKLAKTIKRVFLGYEKLGHETSDS
jgi:hypothetical protein